MTTARADDDYVVVISASGPLRTPRLIMRRWGPADRAPFAAINADPLVMEYFPAPLEPADSDALIDRIESGFDEHGFGLWAVELARTGELLGFTGLVWQSFEARFTPAVEVGWRLTPSAWGYGYATEAARTAVSFGFRVANLTDIVSITTRTNERSQAVMRRLGMHRDPADDFEHPRLPPGHPLRRHVLHRLARSEWVVQDTGRGS